MNISFQDRLISALAYFSFGFFSIVWIIFANVMNKRISNFLQFNLYQAIFISVVLCIVSLLYDIAIGFLNMIPFIGKFFNSFNLFFNATPMFFGFTITGLLVFLFIAVLSLSSLLGIKPKIPGISNIIVSNFGG